MKVREICEALEARVFVPGDPEREVSSVAAGDLLSYVMGTAEEGGPLGHHPDPPERGGGGGVEGSAPDPPGVGGVSPAPDLEARCSEEGICLAGVEASLYGACARLAALGLPG